MPTAPFSRITLGTNLTGTDQGDGEILIDATGGGGGGAVATDAIWDTKGDLAVASAANAASKLPVGSNDQVLVADSAQTLGIKWAAVPGTGAFVPVSTIDAKGDLLVGSANDALDNLPVGSNNQVLTADSAQTLGVKWATPAATGAVATDAIWDTKGDLAVASGADAASKLAVGSNNQVLVADSGQTLGVKWGAVPSGSGGALTLLSSTTLSSDGTFDITSISGAYNDLIIVLIARCTNSAVNDNAKWVFNNDTTANNYYCETVQGVIGSATATDVANVSSSATSLAAGQLPAATAQANAFGVVEMTICGYASTTWYKIVHFRSYTPPQSGSTNQTARRGGALWKNTAALNRITLSGQTTANLLTGSWFRIYGRT